MAYWQNGKVFIHCSTQSTSQTVPAVARWLNIDPSQVVVISEYTGAVSAARSPALSLSSSPRYCRRRQRSGHVAHQPRGGALHRRARPGLLGRMKVGFTKEGKITALDMFVICDSGPYEPAGDGRQAGSIVSLLYQPSAMRWRGSQC